MRPLSDGMNPQDAKSAGFNRPSFCLQSPIGVSSCIPKRRFATNVLYRDVVFLMYWSTVIESHQKNTRFTEFCRPLLTILYSLTARTALQSSKRRIVTSFIGANFHLTIDERLESCRHRYALWRNTTCHKQLQKHKKIMQFRCVATWGVIWLETSEYSSISQKWHFFNPL